MVRQVVSLLRSQLQDKTRPYRLIQTIPKQGYLFDIEVTEQNITRTPSPEESTPLTHIAKPKNKRMVLTVTAILTAGLIVAWALQNGGTTDDTTVITAQQSDVVPVYIHDITLDSTSNFEMAESVYNYLFYGLNSAKNLSGYHYSQLSQQSKQSLANHLSLIHI